jgi:filamentous hemagglutinin
LSGTTKVLSSQGLTDQQIYNYAQQLAGGAPLKQVRPGVWMADLGGGQQIRLRSVSSSQQQTGARWTIDVQGNSQINSSLGISLDKRVELKFK